MQQEIPFAEANMNPERSMIRHGDIYDNRWYREYPDELRYALNPRYQEIIKLHDLLVKNDIPHVIRRVMDGWQICYPDDDNWIADAIEHCGSYGKSNDKLEIMGLLTPDEKAVDDVVGYLTAEDVFERIHTHWSETKGE